MAKHIQVIDGSDNCTYSIFEVTDEDFDLIFCDSGQDIEFAEDLKDRLPHEELQAIVSRIWAMPVEKKEVQGIHGTIFYDLEFKKQYYPSKTEAGMVTGLEPV